MQHDSPADTSINQQEPIAIGHFQHPEVYYRSGTLSVLSGSGRIGSVLALDFSGGARSGGRLANLESAPSKSPHRVTSSSSSQAVTCARGKRVHLVRPALLYPPTPEPRHQPHSHTTPHHTSPHHTTPHYIIPYHTIPYHTKPPHSIVILRTISAYRVENFYVDYKTINNIPIPIPIPKSNINS